MSRNAEGRRIERQIRRDDDFFRLNPQELVGANVAVARTSGRTDQDWVVSGLGERPGTIVVSHASAGYKVLGIDQVLHSIQPSRDAATGARISGAALRPSREFNAKHELQGAEPIADGYTDGGRGMGIWSDGARGVASREVLVVDRSRDARLREHIDVARNLRSLPEADRAQALARYVDETMGGQRPDLLQRNEAAVERVRDREVMIGDAQHVLDGTGVCRHRALLFKVLADEAGLSTTIRRGEARNANNRGAHAWNEVTIDGRQVVVDVMNPSGLARDGGSQFMTPATSPDVESMYHRFDGSAIYAASTAPTRLATA